MCIHLFELIIHGQNIDKKGKNSHACLEWRLSLWNIWQAFVQDGTPSKTVWCLKAFLRTLFGHDRWVTRVFRYVWPPCFIDFRPCDYLLLDYLKINVYRDRITSVEMSKDWCIFLIINIGNLYSAVHKIDSVQLLP